MPQINWYPGHMAKTKRDLETLLRAADAVIELCDARAPLATRNPDLGAMCKGKARFLALNKADLADEGETKAWISRLNDMGLPAVSFQAVGTGGRNRMLRLVEEAARPAIERMKARGAMKTARVMVIGIPNVGKSTFINTLRGKSIAKSGDKPGVTRSSQWIKISPYLELLDTPGMLWPKIESQEQARILGYIGSIRDETMDLEDLAASLLSLLDEIAPEETKARFRFPEDMTGKEEGWMLLEAACRGRGWLLSGGRLDTARASAVILDEFRAGRIGRITLEKAR